MTEEHERLSDVGVEFILVCNLTQKLARIEAMSDDYLLDVTRVNPWGEISRLEAIGQTIIAHGNGHLGQISTALTILGKSGLQI